MSDRPTSAPASDRELTHLPLPDQDTEAFWEAARQHRLLVREAPDGRRFLYPRDRAPGTLDNGCRWVEVTGAGVIYSYTVVHQAPGRAFRDRVPYVLALIDLDGGGRLMSHVLADPPSVQIGARVRLTWRDEGDIALPMFELDAEAETL